MSAETFLKKRDTRGKRGQKVTGWTPFKAMTRITHPNHPWPNNADRAWVNNRFLVLGIPFTWRGQKCGWLEIQRNDGRPGIGWAEIQKIKNQLLGPEAFAFEVYPRESELVDDFNVYHLWVPPQDMKLPTALNDAEAEFADAAGDNPMGPRP